MQNFSIINSASIFFVIIGKLWTAPEILRMEHPPAEGTPKGDVYSFAIIAHEILVRQGPFYLAQSDLGPRGTCHIITREIQVASILLLLYITSNKSNVIDLRYFIGACRWDAAGGSFADVYKLSVELLYIRRKEKLK